MGPTHSTKEKPLIFIPPENLKRESARFDLKRNLRPSLGTSVFNSYDPWQQFILTFLSAMRTWIERRPQEQENQGYCEGPQKRKKCQNINDSVMCNSLLMKPKLPFWFRISGTLFIFGHLPCNISFFKK